MQEGAAHGALSQALQLAQLQALDRVMAIAAFEVDGTLCHANANYLKLMGLAAQARGRRHSSFCSARLLGSDKYGNLDASVRRHAYSGMVERRSDGSSCWLEATYSPVMDAQGRVLHILKIATDVTARHARSRRSRSTCVACRWWRMPPTRRCSSATGLRILHVNGGFTRMFGWPPKKWPGAHRLPCWRPDVRGVRQHLPHRAARRPACGARRDRGRQARPALLGQGHQQPHPRRGRALAIHGVDADRHHPLQDARGLQHRVLEAMARERPLVEVLEMVCQEVESIAPR
jgi:PAS domain S-box-containing protein